MTDARLETYLSDTRRYDELVDGSGGVREHWRPLMDALASNGADAVRRGAELARRLIVENGVTFKKPIGYGKRITQRLSAFAKKHFQYMGYTNIKIIVLLHMPEFMDGQLLVPGQATHITTILFGG